MTFKFFQLSIIYFITLGNEKNFDIKQATPPPPPRESSVQGKMISWPEYSHLLTTCFDIFFEKISFFDALLYIALESYKKQIYLKKKSIKPILFEFTYLCYSMNKSFNVKL